MKMLRDPLFIQFYGCRTEGHLQYLFLEYASGGELFDRIEPDVGMKQSQARTFFQQLIAGVEFLHNKGITHRDLKPENILLDQNDNLKITDFGLSTVFCHRGQERKLSKCCGTPPYVSPEVLSGEEYYAQPADVWSCGVILVAMLAGELPWNRPDEECKEFCDYCTKKSLNLSPWNKISNWPLSLLRRILQRVPGDRFTIQQIKRHRWFTKRSTTVSSHLLSSPSTPVLKRHCSSLTPETTLDTSVKFVDPARIPASQPEPQNRQSLMTELMTLRVVHVSSTTSSEQERANAPSFSQPARAEYWLLPSQISSTPGQSQTLFQRLVKRMTRFRTSCGVKETMLLTKSALEKLGCLVKRATADEVVASVSDRTKRDLVFRITFFPLDGDEVLVDLRRSKGDGLEFKRYFVKISQLLKEIILKVI
ncbi:serine/threonine-protein kinase Chk1-like isoform X2 [Corticium candelabrum]|nr:serine/threonine-protein kinase Chk1-like isoform X2 [Corticium candelabrum]